MSTEMIETIREYFKTQPVLKAWIFGSFARGEETPESDVDILVVYDDSKPVGLMKIANMYVNLKKLLQREVDLVEEGTLLPFAVESANRDKKLIYERAC
ncbi:MAG: nucleotidyltransferase domain-containing protein [Bacteroidales bacterium]|nr:nucleotidyltransferase domain-containing protein [Bacteroidales bacterium]